MGGAAKNLWPFLGSLSQRDDDMGNKHRCERWKTLSNHSSSQQLSDLRQSATFYELQFSHLNTEKIITPTSLDEMRAFIRSFLQ